VYVVLNPYPRSENKRAAAAAAADSADSDVASEADEPAPTSDVEMPDPVDDDVGSDDNMEDKEPKESKKKSKAKSTSKGKGKGKGGVMMPDEWPWEDAKKIFENPEVLPADEVEVSPL
jgi:flap endonuclease-1